MNVSRIRDAIGEVGQVLRAAATSYSKHSGRMLASAVAFSALLSIAPMLYIAIGIASRVVGEGASRASVMHDLSKWVGTQGAQEIFELLDRAHRGRSGLAALAGGVVLLYASTRLFSQIKRTLDHLWDIQPRSGGKLAGRVQRQVRKRALSLLLVVLVSAFIVTVVVVKTMLSFSTSPLEDTWAHVIYRGGEAIISLVTTTLMFAAIFKTLPDAKLAWHDAWRGALVTALLFGLGATIIGLYLGHKTLDVLYGPGGSLVIVLLWVYYSAQVFFFGAAVTGELARRGGRAIEPDDEGERLAPPP